MEKKKQDNNKRLPTKKANPKKRKKNEAMSKAMMGNTNSVGNNGGQPTKYNEEYVEQAYKLTLLGFTNKDLAKFFEVCEETIYEWQRVHGEFSDAIRSGKEIADANIVVSLQKRALGYEYEETKVEVDSNGNEKHTNTVKQVVPDTSAIKMWLSSRQPDRWREKKELDVDVTSNGETLGQMPIITLPNPNDYGVVENINSTDTGDSD